MCFLAVCIVQILCVCCGEVGNHSLNLEVGEFFDFLQLFRSVVGVIPLVADSAHSGVYGDQGFYGLAGSLCRRIDCLCVLKRAENRSNVVFYQSVCIHVRSQSQADDFAFDSGISQCCALCKRSDSEGVDAVFDQDVRGFHAAVTVSVRLDDADHLCIRSDLLLDALDVVIQVRKVNFYPCRT